MAFYLGGCLFITCLSARLSSLSLLLVQTDEDEDQSQLLCEETSLQGGMRNWSQNEKNMRSCFSLPFLLAWFVGCHVLTFFVVVFRPWVAEPTLLEILILHC